MTDIKRATHGSWRSPITSDLIVGESIGLSQPKLHGRDIYWVEMRPSEGGRNVIVRRRGSGELNDITPQPFNARTRVHEYGGGDYVLNQGSVVFSNFSDQRLYITDGTADPRPITPSDEVRYAEPVADPTRSRLLCVREDHRGQRRQPINNIVALDLEVNTESGRALIEGDDFYSSVRVSSDGSQLAWLSWNHPNMPWDTSELWVGEFATDGSVVNTRCIARGNEESVFQPEWSPDGSLYFVSDRNGWWNFYRYSRSGEIEAVSQKEAEFGAPQWLFGMSMYALISPEKIICTYYERGFSQLATIDTRTGQLQALETPYTEITFLRADQDQAVMRAGSPTEALSIVCLDFKTERFEVVKRANNLSLDPGFVSTVEAIEFPTENGLTAHGFFYAPKNRDYRGPEGELPPLLVKSHGGPTSAAVSSLSLHTQYWTSRGIAVLDVNYGGSTGYGRSYRERLKGNWGIVDVDDCVNGARYLVERGLVDANRLMITGGSAGGYTTLCALTFRDYFRAGASHFGVSDAEALAKETHKFESRYLDGLIGPYPEARALYKERSPINYAEQLSCPVIFFQGLEDKVVPPNQAQMMVEILRRKGVMVEYVEFPGEQHGFRQAENIKRALDGELGFYSRVFGFGGEIRGEGLGKGK